MKKLRLHINDLTMNLAYYLNNIRKDKIRIEMWEDDTPIGAIISNEELKLLETLRPSEIAKEIALLIPEEEEELSEDGKDLYKEVE